MKITKDQLLQVVQEELSDVIQEKWEQHQASWHGGYLPWSGLLPGTVTRRDSPEDSTQPESRAAATDLEQGEEETRGWRPTPPPPIDITPDRALWSSLGRPNRPTRSDIYETIIREITK